MRGAPCRSGQIARLQHLSPRRGPSHHAIRSYVRVTSQVKTATREVPGLHTMLWTGSKEQTEVRASLEGVTVAITRGICAQLWLCGSRAGTLVQMV